MRFGSHIAVLVAALAALLLLWQDTADAQGSQPLTAVISAVTPNSLEADRRRRRRVKKRKRLPRKLLRPKRRSRPLAATMSPDRNSSASMSPDRNSSASVAAVSKASPNPSRLEGLRSAAGVPKPKDGNVFVRSRLRPIKLTRRFRVDPGQPSTRPVPLNSESSKAPIKIERAVRVNSRNPGAVVPKVR